MKKLTDLPEPEKYIKGIEDIADLSTWTVDDLEVARERLGLLRDQCRREKNLALQKRAVEQYVLLGQELKERKNKL